MIPLCLQLEICLAVSSHMGLASRQQEAGKFQVVDRKPLAEVYRCREILEEEEFVEGKEMCRFGLLPWLG